MINSDVERQIKKNYEFEIWYINHITFGSICIKIAVREALLLLGIAQCCITPVKMMTSPASARGCIIFSIKSSVFSGYAATFWVPRICQCYAIFRHHYQCQWNTKILFFAICKNKLKSSNHTWSHCGSAVLLSKCIKNNGCLHIH